MSFKPDLIREILLNLDEKKPLYNDNGRLKGYTNSEINEHLNYLIEADFILADVKHVQGQQAGIYIIKRITLKGQEFLEAARDDTPWNRMKEKLKSVVEPITLELMLSLLMGILKG